MNDLGGGGSESFLPISSHTCRLSVLPRVKKRSPTEGRQSLGACLFDTLIHHAYQTRAAGLSPWLTGRAPIGRGGRSRYCMERRMPSYVKLMLTV